MTTLTWTSCILLKSASESNTTYCRNNSSIRNYSNNEDWCNKIHIEIWFLSWIIMPYTIKWYKDFAGMLCVGATLLCCISWNISSFWWNKTWTSFTRALLEFLKRRFQETNHMVVFTCMSFKKACFSIIVTECRSQEWLMRLVSSIRLSARCLAPASPNQLYCSERLVCWYNKGNIAIIQMTPMFFPIISNWVNVWSSLQKQEDLEHPDLPDSYYFKEDDNLTLHVSWVLNSKV